MSAETSEEEVGARLLETFLGFNQFSNMTKYELKALRLSSKRIKSAMDALITRATTKTNDDLRRLVQRNWSLVDFKYNSRDETSSYELYCLLHYIFWQFPLLQRLEMSNWYVVRDLPPQICQLPLSSLRLHGRHLILPASFGNLTKLEELKISVSIYQLEETAGIAPVQDLQNLKRLNLDLSSGSELGPLLPGDFDYADYDEWETLKLPEYIYQISSLYSLNLQIYSCHAPHDLGRLTQLKELYFCDYCVDKLPDSISNLCSLKILGFVGCINLERFPEAIGKLSALQDLSVQFCQSFEALPDSISDLKSLTSLSICSCPEFQELPSSIVELKNSLKELEVDYCWDSLPESIAALTSLQDLIICDFTMDTVPEALTQLTSLTRLEFRDCDYLVLSDAVRDMKAVTVTNS